LLSFLITQYTFGGFAEQYSFDSDHVDLLMAYYDYKSFHDILQLKTTRKLIGWESLFFHYPLIMNHAFTLTQPYIELSKLLKFLDLVNNGGHAKDVILDGLVYVNEKQEYRIRNKLKV
jgi:ribosome-associated protein YbcJ (S4-like RNA binding protein)